MAWKEFYSVAIAEDHAFKNETKYIFKSKELSFLLAVLRRKV